MLRFSCRRGACISNYFILYCNKQTNNQQSHLISNLKLNRLKKQQLATNKGPILWITAFRSHLSRPRITPPREQTSSNLQTATTGNNKQTSRVHSVGTYFFSKSIGTVSPNFHWLIPTRWNLLFCWTRLLLVLLVCHSRLMPTMVVNNGRKENPKMRGRIAIKFRVRVVVPRRDDEEVKAVSGVLFWGWCGELVKCLLELCNRALWSSFV